MHMPHHKAAIKDLRRTKRATERNRANRSTMRSAVTKAMVSKDKENAAELMKEAMSAVDKNVKRKLIHKNTAARKKSQIQKRLAKLVK